MNFFTKCRILWQLYQKLDTPRAQEVDLGFPLGEADKRDLAFGRWENFKWTHTLGFMIGLTTDNEYILSRMAMDTIHSARTKCTSSVAVKFTGDELLERARLMESWCHEMLENHQTVDEWIQTHDTP